MSDGWCARCQSPVSEQDLTAGRGASLGALLLCERCAVPAEEAADHRRSAPAKQSSSVQVIAPASATLPAVVPFSEAAVPIAQSTFFKDMDAEGLGSGDQPAQAEPVTTTVEPLHAKPPSRRMNAPTAPLKAVFSGIACGAGSFVLILFVYVTFLHSAPARNPMPVKPGPKAAQARLELPPPAKGSVITPAVPGVDPAKPQLVASTNTRPAPVPSPSVGSVKAAEEAFEAIRKVPDSDSKEKCRLLEAFLKAHDGADVALMARARVMLERYKPFQIRMDFESKLQGWEVWEGALNSESRKAHSGNRALISGPDNSGGGTWLKDVIPGRTYVVTFWSKKDPEVAGCYVGCEFGDAAKVKSNKRDALIEWTDYQQRTFETTAPANAQFLFFWVWREKGKGEVCIDDVEITEK